MSMTVEEVRELPLSYIALLSGYITNLQPKNIQRMQRRKRNLAKFTLDGAESDSGTLEVGSNLPMHSPIDLFI